MSQQTFRSGPIPSPKEFEGYKRINPDFPERIFKQFEEDSETNRNLQKEAQAADIELESMDGIYDNDARINWNICACLLR